jgi:putative PIG3 family NAD(P)H quinone oxidoreductase
MKAIVITQPGGPEVLRIQERPLPEPGAEQVRVRVLVAGLNRADIMQRRGRYPAPPGVPADIPGLEIMGVVDAVGAGVTAWQAGQRVFGLVAGGGCAQYVVTHERLLAAVPENLSDVDAGAVPEVFMTAHDALFTQAELVMGERVLIHAAGSGVGTAAIQLVKAIGGTTYGTARSPEKLERARKLGLDIVLPLPDFVPALREATEGQGVHVVIDFVGGPYLAQNLLALSVQGRLVQVGAMGGGKAEIDLSLVMGKRLKIAGTVLRARPLEEKALVTRRFAHQVVPLLGRGVVRPVVDRVFAFEQVVQAHEYLESNASFGKVLLQMDEALYATAACSL